MNSEFVEKATHLYRTSSNGTSVWCYCFSACHRQSVVFETNLYSGLDGLPLAMPFRLSDAKQRIWNSEPNCVWSHRQLPILHSSYCFGFGSCSNSNFVISILNIAIFSVRIHSGSCSDGRYDDAPQVHFEFCSRRRYVSPERCETAALPDHRQCVCPDRKPRII